MELTDPSSPGELRVLHWNIHSWRDETGASNLEAIVRLIQRVDAQVVSLVEVDESWDRPESLAEVARRTGYFSSFVPVFEFGDDAPAGGFGNAILSKVPPVVVRQRQLLWPPRVYDGTEQTESRGIMLVKFQTPSVTIWVGTTHLPRNEADSRAYAAQRAVDAMQRLPEPWLLVGDFNMPAALWLSDFPRLRSYPSVASPTHPSERPVEAIDYCIASDGLSVQAEVLHEPGSDHLPVLVRYQPG